MARIKYQEAIGLEVKRGRPQASPAPSKAHLVRLYIKERRSVRNVAAMLGCSKDAVYRALKQYGITTRSNVRRSKLQRIPLKGLKVAVQERGLRATARDLGIDHSTLRHHLKVRSSK